MGQTNSAFGMEKIVFNLLLEGTMSHAIFQRNNLNLSFRFSFQFGAVKGELGGLDLWLLIIL
jgi:hypothetical protein